MTSKYIPLKDKTDRSKNWRRKLRLLEKYHRKVSTRNSTRHRRLLLIDKVANEITYPKNPIDCQIFLKHLHVQTFTSLSFKYFYPH